MSVGTTRWSAALRERPCKNSLQECGKTLAEYREEILEEEQEAAMEAPSM